MLRGNQRRSDAKVQSKGGLSSPLAECVKPTGELVVLGPVVGGNRPCPEDRVQSLGGPSRNVEGARQENGGRCAWSNAEGQTHWSTVPASRPNPVTLRSAMRTQLRAPEIPPSIRC